MKENSGSINQVLFGQFFNSVAGDSIENHLRAGANEHSLLDQGKYPKCYRDLHNGGDVFSLCITLFLYQLAEFGW